MQGKTAIVGRGDGVLAFKAGGVDAYPAEDALKAREIIRKIAKNYNVLFLTDDLAEELGDLIERMNESPYPVIVPVPSVSGASGYAKDRMREQMERALGVDILFQREER